jgi:large subunit ribosomal protein L4
MSQITVYNQKGEKVGTTALDPTIFSVPERPDLIHQAVVYQMAAERRPYASTKTRAEVRGGGKKPWRQKGTGRARAGSIRSPIWRGGGIVFGPTKERNFKKKMPKKMRNLALFSALSNKLKANQIILLDKLEFKNIKTKQVEEMLNKLPIKEGTILLVLPKLEPKIMLSCHNLTYLKVITVPFLNVVDVLKYDWLLFTKDALKQIGEIYLK